MKIAFLITNVSAEEPFFSCDLELHNVAANAVMSKVAKMVTDLIQDDHYAVNAAKREAEEAKALHHAVVR